MRYDLDKTFACWEIYFYLIKINKPISFQDLATQTKKDKGTLSQQIKPLIKQKFVFTKGSGKKNHPLMISAIKKQIECPCCKQVFK